MKNAMIVCVPTDRFAVVNVARPLVSVDWPITDWPSRKVTVPLGSGSPAANGCTVPLTMNVTKPVGVRARGVVGLTVTVKVGRCAVEPALAATAVRGATKVIGSDLDGRWFRSPPNQTK